ncbi:ribonuclease H-like domain-containing protein [Candidatus Pacearchaeota archaeon]|nr:ribonuclease H-like domain-containing protein [Candidatus Pacearchaeota archaeon]
MELKFIPLDYDYFDFNNETFVRVWGRTADGKRVCAIDAYNAYFWLILKENLGKKDIEIVMEKVKGIKSEFAGRKVYVKNVEFHEKNFLGKPVKALKVTVSNHKDMQVISERAKDFEEVKIRRETDVSFITRYIIEKKVLPLQWHSVSGELLGEKDFGGMFNILDVDIAIKAENISATSEDNFLPKIMAFDIETDSLEIGKGSILMISAVSENLKKVLTWKKFPAEGYVEFCKDEADMIEKFCSYIKKEKPDALVGYFSDGFDMPYLRARAEKHKIKMDISLDGSQPVFARGRITSSRLAGIVHIDLFRFIETAYSQYLQSETLGLNEVALELLGEGKKDFEHKHSAHITHSGWKQYFEYNLQDAVLTYKLAGKAWQDMAAFSRIIQEPLFEITRDRMSQLVENYLLHNLHKFNEIAEKRPLHDEIEERRMRKKYEGAFVFQPVPALYENLAMFDFTSMYASIIATHNLSKSTQLEKKEKEALEVELEEHKAYFTKNPGFFSLMLNDIINKRKKYKQEYKKNPDAMNFARSNAYKLLANAAYGYQGFFGARYYCIDAAAATAALARKFLKGVIDKINSFGCKVVYADTDGIAFLLQDKSKQEVLNLLEKLNSGLPGIMELELEEFYKRGIWVTKRTGEFGAKKKYALLNEKNQLKVRGFETVRRDWCNLAREVQNEILSRILKEGNATSSLKFVQDVIKKLKKREIEKEKLVIKTQLKKEIAEYVAEGPHVTIAKKMIALGMPVDTGMLIEYYIAEGNGKGKKQLVREKAKLPDEQGRYDITYYIEHQIVPAVENIFEVFGITKGDLTGKSQKKLHEF